MGGSTRAPSSICDNEVIPALLKRIEGDKAIGAPHQAGHVRPLNQKAYHVPAVGVKDRHVDMTKALECAVLSPWYMNLHAREVT